MINDVKIFSFGHIYLICFWGYKQNEEYCLDVAKFWGVPLGPILILILNFSD
jgi:hypothetical protein